MYFSKKTFQGFNCKKENEHNCKDSMSIIFNDTEMRMKRNNLTKRA